jgi:hypothetical protein
MRDETLIRADVIRRRDWERQNLNPDGSPSGPPYYGGESTVNRLRTLMSRGRSDITPSDGVKPTNYVAWDYSVTPGAVSGIDEYSLISPRRRYKNTYSGQWMPDVELVLNGHLTNGITSPIISTQLEDEADTAALLNLQNSKVNIANNYGEIASNASMMYDTAVKLLRVYRAVRAKEYHKIDHILGTRYIGDFVDTFRDQWLAYRFGWKPLVSDIWNLQEAIKTAYRSQNLAFTVKGQAYQSSAPTSIDYRFNVEGTTMYGVNVEYGYKVSDRSLRGLDSLGFQNPLALLWELAPYSFVYDYFAAIGDFLTQLTAPQGCEFDWGYRTHWTRSNVLLSHNGSFSMTDPSNAWKNHAQPVALKSFAMQRQIRSSFYFGAPRITLVPKPNQSMTIVKLLTQRA